jgi:hypothetical protein
VVHAAVRDHRVGDHGWRRGDEWRDQVHHAVRAERHDVFLREQLDHVGERVEQAEHGDAVDVGAVRADPVLHHGALLALDPGDHRRDRRHHHEQDEQRLDQHLDDHEALPSGAPPGPTA